MVRGNTREWAGESKWKKSEHPITVWASIRANNNFSPDTNEKYISALCGSELKMGGNGAKHLASFLGVDLLDSARAEESGWWRGGGVSIPGSVEALA